MRTRLSVVLLLPALLCGASGRGLRVPKDAASAVLTLPDGFKVAAELALTPEERERGLMFRKSLAEDRGMLFVFEDGGLKTFWMKNTLIDLDMVFLDGEMKVERVFHRVPRSYGDQPESEVARASSPAWYVLELASGAARSHKLRPGSRLAVSFAGPEKKAVAVSSRPAAGKSPSPPFARPEDGPKKRGE
ncbi:MAG: DUF192 domain-containing protein [Elusimicrobia bacterium]|nr:DUF192 domain-containing protein [Elusimicrobiota bacterium]